jgi:TonB family protein
MIKKKIILNPLFLSILIHITLISSFIAFYATSSKQKDLGVRITNISIEGDPTRIIGEKSLKRLKSSLGLTETNSDKTAILKTKTHENKLTRQNKSMGQNGGTELSGTDNYIGSILKKIHNNKNYPSQAKRMKLEGITTISFILNKNGDLEKTLVKKTSGHKILDSSAINTITKAAPYPSFPKDIRAKQLELEVDIEFIL